MTGHEECGNYRVPCYLRSMVLTWNEMIKGLGRHTELCAIRGNFGDLY